MSRNLISLPKTKLSCFWDVTFIIRNFLIPLTVLAFYCGSFTLLSRYYLTPGVNSTFSGRLFIYLLILIAIIAIYSIFIYLIKFRGKKKVEFNRSSEKILKSDFLLLLLPLTPVVQYIIKNSEMLSALDMIYVLVFFVIFCSIYIYLIPILLRKVGSLQISMILGVSYQYAIMYMAVLSNTFQWSIFGSFKVLLPLLGGVFIVIWLFYFLNSRKFLYLIIIFMFIGNTASQIITLEPTSGTSIPSTSENNLLRMVNDREPNFKPDIYLLVYDGYVPNETLQNYGIDNSQQENYLIDMGFELYPHTYSIGESTIDMSRVLNASVEFYGPVRRGISGDSVVHNLLRSYGYKTIGLFPTDYMFRGIDSSYDFSIPEKKYPGSSLLINAILIGEFRFDQGFDDIPRELFLGTKNSIFSSSPDSLIFTYMHSDLPSHSPTSGACEPDETEIYKERISLANAEMRKDINNIIANDPGAIIIVAGDHGPYLFNCNTNNKWKSGSDISREEIQDSYATFLAIKWPSADYTNYDEIVVLQDIFPSIFAYLFQDDSLLDARVAPVIIHPYNPSVDVVDNGIIIGGINDGESLFLSGE